jgi:hypothetical protein
MSEIRIKFDNTHLQITADSSLFYQGFILLKRNDKIFVLHNVSTDYEYYRLHISEDIFIGGENNALSLIRISQPIRMELEFCNKPQHVPARRNKNVMNEISINYDENQVAIRASGIFNDGFILIESRDRLCCSYNTRNRKISRELRGIEQLFIRQYKEEKIHGAFIKVDHLVEQILWAG